MGLTKYHPTTRLSAEKITLHNLEMARFISKRKHVSAKALSQALNILGEGILDALAEGYDFQWRGLGTFETRELKPRLRYHRQKSYTYTSDPSVIVHFRKSPNLNEMLRKRANERTTKLAEISAVRPVGRGI